MQDKDVDAAVGMTYEPCIVTGAQGVGRINRDEFRRPMTNGKTVSGEDRQ
jgi:hypothetical protein